jgi:prefoldin subunit 5
VVLSTGNLPISGGKALDIQTAASLSVTIVGTIASVVAVGLAVWFDRRSKNILEAVDSNVQNIRTALDSTASSLRETTRTLESVDQRLQRMEQALR